MTTTRCLRPQDIFEIIKEGRMLHHCVGNDGAGERYYDRMERRESFIMFLLPDGGT